MGSLKKLGEWVESCSLGGEDSIETYRIRYQIEIMESEEDELLKEAVECMRLLRGKAFVGSRVQRDKDPLILRCNALEERYKEYNE